MFTSQRNANTAIFWDQFKSIVSSAIDILHLPVDTCNLANLDLIQYNLQMLWENFQKTRTTVCIRHNHIKRFSYEQENYSYLHNFILYREIFIPKDIFSGESNSVFNAKVYCTKFAKEINKERQILTVCLENSGNFIHWFIIRNC